MLNQRLNEKRANRGPTTDFFKEAARAGIIMLTLAGPAIANAEETTKTTVAPSVETEVGRYPNFSGAGVHGNPALWPEYGNWGYAELSGSPSQDKTSLSAILSSALARNVHGLLKLNSTDDSHSTIATASGALALSLPYTFRTGIGFGMDSMGKATAQAGIASVMAWKRLLMRNGIEYDLPARQITTASEVRGAFGKFELTGSASVSAIFKDGVDYAGQAVGVQTRYGSHLLSFGAGGASIKEWDKFRLHYRLWAAKDTSVDLHLRGKGIGLFKNPDYIGMGITQVF